ncbi:Amino acid ABC transporter, permease protein [plant metagenome]|uniref:Amino acid ABC transporter, permease protein n=1 Tax=plant metagenome TaxID=1297885 RepID=A0A484RQ04_9ZZZZ
MLLFFCVLLLPHQLQLFGWSIPFPAWVKGILGLTLPVMGNVSEVVRGGIQSLPSGQWEAANALAFSRWQTLRLIILPQAIKRMVPPWMNVYAVLMMATPLVSIVGVEDSVSVARSVLSAENSPALLMPVYGLLLVLFFAYCAPIARWTRALEKRFAIA